MPVHILIKAPTKFLALILASAYKAEITQWT